MTDAPATNELRELADNVRIVALDAADYIGHANYGHRIIEAKQSIRDACDELEVALRAAATPSAEVSVEELAACLRKFVGWDGEMEAARALLGKYRVEKRS